MAYNDDAVLSKLSALNESHDSIATAAQWIMFHRRHSERTVHLWLQKLKDLPSPKRLNLLYLANEVVQQSKARHKEDFLREFSPFIAEATALAYKGASSDIQAKLKRVVDVWRDRNIFELPVQESVEARLEELDKARSTAKVGGFGGSIFGASSGVPSELSPLVGPLQKLSKSVHQMNSAVKTADTEYEKLTDPIAPVPTAPVHAARLNGLMKTLATAEGAVADRVKDRQAIIDGLEKLLQTHREGLAAEQAVLTELGSRKTSIESKKQEVEVAIIRGMSQTDKEQSPLDTQAGNTLQEPDRPEVEALTPPHISDNSDIYGGSPQNGQKDPAPTTSEPPSVQQPPFPSAPGIEMLSTLASQYHAVPVNGSNKKRKVDSSEEIPDLGGDEGIDADVAEMLRKDSHGNRPQFPA